MVRRIVLLGATVFAVATIALWIDSCRFRKPYPFIQGFRGWCVNCTFAGGSGIHVTVHDGGLSVAYRHPVEQARLRQRNRRIGTQQLGYREDAYGRERFCSHSMDAHYVAPSLGARLLLREVLAPIPLLTFMLLSYPTIALARGPLRRWRRRRKGQCLKCGYSLTGLTEPRCPECATSFDRARVLHELQDAEAR